METPALRCGCPPGVGLAFLLVLLLTTAPFLGSRAQFVESNLCRGVCMCMPALKTVDCNKQDKLSGIPTNLQITFLRLTIQHGQFHQPAISRANLTGLEHLTYLKVIYSNIRMIYARAFAGMAQLRYLDLSHNSLVTLVPFAFYGLELDALHLQQNPNIELYPQSFQGLRVKELNLRNNGIRDILYETFAGLGLVDLYLFNNSIRTVDRRFAKIFDRPPKMMDLTANPLLCSCTLAWLVRLVRAQASSNGGAAYQSINITCDSPRELKGRELRSLDPARLPCPRPNIRSVSLDVGPRIAQLVCTAVGSPAPFIAWSYMENGNLKELRRIPQYNRDVASNLYQPLNRAATPFLLAQQESSIMVNVTLGPNMPAYTCTAWNEADERQSVVVKLRGPPPTTPVLHKDYDVRSMDRPGPSDDGGRYAVDTPLRLDRKPSPSSSPKDHQEQQSTFTRPTMEHHYLFQKQFTLLEMIGAVVGTFTATLALLLIVSRCVTLCRRRRAKNTTYWSTHGSAYSGTGSHEYDVPRVEHTYRPAKMDEIEFLDFKTQRKMCNGT